MAQDDNLDLAELDAGTADMDLQDDNDGSLPEASKPPTNAKELEAVYDIPVQVSAVLGKANMQVSQLLKLGRGAVVELRGRPALPPLQYTFQWRRDDTRPLLARMREAVVYSAGTAGDQSIVCQPGISAPEGVAGKIVAVRKAAGNGDQIETAGKIGLAVTPADPSIVYATIEAGDDARGFYQISRR